MTDPIKGISGAQGTSAGGNYSGGRFSEDHTRHSVPKPQQDLIEISQGAHDRSTTGKKKKGLLEYLRELLE